MALQCFNCGKGVMYGHNVSHAKNRTRKIFKPNLHITKVTINGVTKKVKLCTKCQRKLKTSASVNSNVKSTASEKKVSVKKQASKVEIAPQILASEEIQPQAAAVK